MRRTPLDRVIDALVDASRRTAWLVLLAYGSGLAGLLLVLVDGAFRPTGSESAVGIALMGISFVALFYLSLTVLDATGASGE